MMLRDLLPARRGRVRRALAAAWWDGLHAAMRGEQVPDTPGAFATRPAWLAQARMYCWRDGHRAGTETTEAPDE